MRDKIYSIWEGGKAMKAYVKFMDGLPRIVKIIFALPILSFLWGFYRIAKSASKKNTIGVILAIILFFFSGFILWIIDLITIIVKGKILWID
jgi:hypothetical protein